MKIEASNPGVALYTLHLKTPSGAKNHSAAEAQYRTLSNYPGTNTSLYYPVNAGDVEAFGRKVDSLAAAITSRSNRPTWVRTPSAAQPTPRPIRPTRRCSKMPR